jgi:DNA polymerase
MAAEIFDIKEPDVTEEHRDLGKRVILGAGFGMGPDKFVITCKMQGNKIIERELAVKAINAYRTRYSEVAKFWKDLEFAAMRCVAGDVGNKQRVGKLLFTLHKKYMTITLPSGRDLYYWYPSIKEQETKWGTKDAVHFWYVDSQKGNKWVEGSSYGGLWAENVTQACARDVMAPAMLEVERVGHTPIFSVHDEIVLEDDINFKSLKSAEDTMLLSLPKWADGLPLVVKGWEGKRYKK